MPHHPLAVVSIVACLLISTGAVAGAADSSTPGPTAASSPSSAPTVTSPSGGGSAAPATPPAADAAGTTAPSGDAIDQQLAAALAQQDQLDAIKAQIAQEIALAQGEQQHLASLVVANGDQVSTLAQQINLEQRHLEDAVRRSADAAAKADAARREAASDRAALTDVVRTEYMQTGGFVGWLLSATSLSDFLDRDARANQILDGGRQLIRNLGDAEATAATQAAEAEKQAAQAREAATMLDGQRQQLQLETAKEQALVGQLSSQTSAAARELAGVDKQTSEVAQQVAALRIAQLDRTIADSEQAVWDDAQVYLRNNLGNLPAAPAGVDAGYSGAVQGLTPVAGRPLLLPAAGASVSQLFGPSVNSFEPAAFGFAHFHTGIDFAAPMGTPIHAAAGGVVVSASPGSTGYGNHIVIASDQHLLSLYGHLEIMLVKVGDVVHQGQLIALMGSTGNSTGPHVHFEVRIDGTPVDPAPLLSGAVAKP